MGDNQTNRSGSTGLNCKNYQKIDDNKKQNNQNFWLKQHPI